MNNELPDWYVLKEKKLGKEIDLEELVIIGKERIDSLSNLESDIADILLDSRKAYLSHLALRITAAIIDDIIFMNWFLEKEGDFFQKMFDQELFVNKMKILKNLFKNGFMHKLNEIISKLKMNLNKDELRILVGSSIPLQKKMLPSDTIVAVRYYFVPKALSGRIGYIEKGWILIPLRLLRSDIKRFFQKKMKQKITELKKNLVKDEERLRILSEVARELMEYWKKKIVIYDFDAKFFDERKKLYTLTEFYPLCMEELINRLKATGYLSHSERLQLGLFLKRLGMSLEEQLEFWYKNAVDNIGISWEEFEKKAGYIIRHIYGLEGSKKDYEAPKCETIIHRYYCFYSANDLSSIRSFLTKKGIGKNSIDKIIENIKNKQYQLACSYFLNAKYKTRYSKPMSHPLLFFRLAYKAKKGNSKENI